MAVSTTSTLNDLVPQIVAEALFVASERSIMRGLVRNYSIGPGQGASIVVPIYPQSTAIALSEGGDITANTISTSGATLTVAEVGLMASVSDLSRISSSTDVVSDIGRLLGEAIARKMDQDLTGHFDNFTTNVLGNVTAATGTITAADIFKATAKLRSIGVPAGDLYCVLHPAIAYDLKANLTATYSNPNAGVIQNEAMAMGYLGMLAGVPVYETSNINNNGTTGDFVGGLFHRDALGLAMMQDIRIETQRDASLRADEIVATAMYGHGVLYESYGVALGFDSTIL
jgi:N4-gp56 family major capsid protein